MRTHIKNIDWAIVWDDASQPARLSQRLRHRFRGQHYCPCGRPWQGAADDVVDGSGPMIMPGLVNIHCHSRSGPIGKGIMEELGTPTFWMSGLYDAKAAFWKGSSVPGDEATPTASSQLTYHELLLGGVTTVLDLSAPYDAWIETVARTAACAACSVPGMPAPIGRRAMVTRSSISGISQPAVGTSRRQSASSNRPMLIRRGGCPVSSHPTLSIPRPTTCCATR